MSIHMLSNNLLPLQLADKRCVLNALSHHHRVAILGMDLGRHGIVAGDSVDGRAARDLRTHGVVNPEERCLSA